jgi:hypothetical protein
MIAVEDMSDARSKASGARSGTAGRKGVKGFRFEGKLFLEKYI